MKAVLMRDFLVHGVNIPVGTIIRLDEYDWVGYWRGLEFTVEAGDFEAC